MNFSVDGVWLPWSDWDDCSVSCGGAIHYRYRECEGPFYGGANCSGPGVDDQACNTHHCPGQNVDLEVFFAQAFLFSDVGTNIILLEGPSDGTTKFSYLL